MKVTPTRGQLFSLESIAMTDIVLNMFIFFFISFSVLATFNPSSPLSQFEVALPAAASGTVVASGPIIVTVTKHGAFYLARDRVSFAQLETTLRQWHGEAPERPLVVRADQAAACEHVVKIFDLARGLGMPRLGLAVQALETAAPPARSSR